MSVVTDNGPQVIVSVRKDDPSTYLRVIASILPKELTVSNTPLDEISDDELLEVLVKLRSIIVEEGQKRPQMEVQKWQEKSKLGEHLN